MSFENNNGYARRYRHNSSNRNSPQPQRDMERSWRRPDAPSKSEMSSSAWHSPQQFIIEQDQIRRAEYLAEKAADPSYTKGPVNTQLTIVDKPKREPTASTDTDNNINISKSSTTNKRNQHNHDSKYYIDQSSSKAYVSIEDIVMASPSPPDASPSTSDTSQANVDTSRQQEGEQTTGSWRSEQGWRNDQRSTKSDYGNRNKQQSNRQWRHKHPDDKHYKHQPVFFKYFMDYDQVMNGLDTGDLYKCTLRINRRKRMDAYATSEALDGDIYLFGDSARNRALDGDIVAVRLLDVDTIWQKRTDRDKRFHDKRKDQLKQETLDTKEEETDIEQDDTATPVATLEEDDTTTAKDNPEEDDNDDDDDNSEKKPKYAGEVVYILDRADGMTFTGIISTYRPGSTPRKPVEGKPAPEIKHIWFKPTDKRTPLMMIGIRDAPDDVISNSEFYETQLMEASLVRWPISFRSPFGKIVRTLGPIGDLNVEEQAVLADNNIMDVPFDNLVMKHLEEIPRSIPVSEIAKRRDLRQEAIFTIDPSTAKDLDDALHIKRLDNGCYEVGVHIADVSHYVKKDTLLDSEAKKRGTTTYLVNRSIPMLPRPLCEDLCSLSPDEDKLAFSVIWVLDEEGSIQKTWFGRTVIRSCSKLAYEDAQHVIDNGHLPEHATISTFAKELVEDSIRDLFKLSVILRKKRYDNGALSMNSVKLSFTLNDNDKPIGVSVFNSREANKLIEEFMLLANISVAEKIYDAYPSASLLRRHEVPIERRLLQFLDTTRELGYDFNVGSAGGLQASFEELDDPEVKDILLVLAIQPMKRATYICSGAVRKSKFLHYALNQDYYTHFTSPIRRYADVIVHRLLDAAISKKVDCGYDTKTVQKIALRCNRKKDGAKNAQEADIMLYLAHYLSSLDGIQTETAVVIGVNKQRFDIYVPKYGLEYCVQPGALPLEKYTFDDGVLDLVWKPGVQVNQSYFDKARERKWDDAEEDDTVEKADDSTVNDSEKADDSTVNDSEKADDSTVNDSEKGDDSMDALANNVTRIKTDDPLPRKLHPAVLDKCKQSIDLLTTIDVHVIPDNSQTPPRIHIFPVNPF